MIKTADIDFEFFNTSEECFTVVCCSIRLSDTGEIFEYWTLDREDKIQCKLHISDLSGEGYIFLAHAVTAEAGAFYSLGIDPTDFKWIDTFIEFRMLTNSNDKLAYGKHYVKGRECFIKKPKPKWQRKEGEGGAGAKLTHSLSSAVYKFLGEKIDTKHKNEMRDIIISGDLILIEENRKQIQDYCTSDIIFLRPMFDEMVKHYKKLLPIKLHKQLKKGMLYRGETMARAAIMERKGYYVNIESTRNFANSVPNILKEIQRDINQQFPEVKPFHLDKNTRNFVRKEVPIRNWIDSEGLGDGWMMTAGKKYSLKVDAFKKFFNYRHDFPRGNFGAQMLRFLNTKQHLNGFMPTTKKKTFWDSVGSDGVVRPYLNPYGSQTARYQPSATGFLFLKAAWMRSLAVPPKGKMYVGIDFTSEEFLIAALLSGDETMLKSYFAEGGPYLNFGKEAGAIPKEGTKESHPVERQTAKSTVLGLSFAMTKFGLARELTEQTGRKWDEDEAQEWVDLFNETYSDHHYWKEEVLDNYELDGYLILPDGWVLFGDNENHRSVGNCPVQGFGSCILRKAIQLAQDAGIDFRIPLHDAGYIICDVNDWETVDRFADLMRDAFAFYFEGKNKETALKVGLDIEAWGPELFDGKTLTPSGREVKVEILHKDTRAKGEYEKFKRFFETPDSEYL